MSEFLKKALAVAVGAAAAFFGQYGLFFVLVAVAVVLDVVTGLIRAKATSEGLSSEKARKGFWRKMALFVALIFGIFLDYAAITVLAQTGVKMPFDMPFALIVCAYIIINESISVCENLYLANPDSFPPAVGKWLKIAKKQVEAKGDVDDDERALHKSDST